MSPEVTLVGATAVHAGFQLTVTILVYPALARVPPDRWHENHAAHSRAITPLVVVVYGVLILACGRVLLDQATPLGLLAVAASALSVLVTALVAAPAHGRLSAGPDARLMTRLLRADRVRAGLGCAAVLFAVAAALR